MSRDFQPSVVEDSQASQLGPRSSIRARPRRTDTTPTTYSQWRSTNDDRQERDADARTLERHWTEKPQRQTISVDDEYYMLNPWHDQQRDRPVFGLAQPLPRTVRKGMHRGKDSRSDSYEGQHQEIGGDARNHETQSRGQGAYPSFDDDYFANDCVSEGQHDRHSIQVPLNDHEQADNMPRERGIEEHGLQFAESTDPQRHTFGVQDGLPPLQEMDTRRSSKTQKEQREAGENEAKARRQFYDKYRNPLARLRARHPQVLAEWLALCTIVDIIQTTIYIFLGICGNLSVATSDSTQGGFQTQAWAWGMAVMVGIYVAGGISGAHLNPCVSVSLSLFRGFPWCMCFYYVISQLFAGFCAGGLAWLLYRDSIYHFDPTLLQELTGKAIYTVPQPWVSTSTAFFNEFISAAILVCVVFALGDDQNSPPGAGMNALILGLLNYLLVITMSFNTGPAISPARDFGPRLVALWAGYGTQTFTTGWWAYGPWGAAFSGSIVGGLMYDSFVFVGAESPVNYHWWGLGDIRAELRERKGKVEQECGTLEV